MCADVLQTPCDTPWHTKRDIQWDMPLGSTFEPADLPQHRACGDISNPSAATNGAPKYDQQTKSGPPPSFGFQWKQFQPFESRSNGKQQRRSLHPRPMIVFSSNLNRSRRKLYPPKIVSIKTQWRLSNKPWYLSTLTPRMLCSCASVESPAPFNSCTHLSNLTSYRMRVSAMRDARFLEKIKGSSTAKRAFHKYGEFEALEIRR